MRGENGVINFKVYENANDLLGIAEVTLPEIAQKTEEITGAGIAGGVSVPFIGQIEAMTTTLNFRSLTKSAIKLAEPVKHQLDLRAAQQYTDSSTGKVGIDRIKHVVIVQPVKINPGKLAPASTADAAVELATLYLATYINGEEVLEIDPINNIYKVNGVDYLTEVRKALGN